MKKYFIIVCLLTISPCCFGQYTIGSSDDPYLSLSEKMIPFLMYKQACEQAVAQVEEYMEKSYIAREDGSWRLEKYYLEKVISKDAQFKQVLISNEDRKNIKARIAELAVLIRQEQNNK